MNKNPLIHQLLAFLDDSPTAWHAVAAMLPLLKEKKFTQLSEQERWSLKPGERYAITRNGSSLCAFVLPKQLPKRLRLLASHTDSPSFKLKPQPEIRKHQSILLGVEVYGAPLITSWFNRDLALAGRVLTKNAKGQITETIVKLDRYPLTIPQLAIHLDREVNEKGFIINKQEHLNVLAGLESSLDSSMPYLETILRDEIGEAQLLAHDLFLYPLEKSGLIGYQDSLIAGYRIDSLTSVHAALTALLHAPDPLEEEIKMVIFWDNEEVGSQTAQGAESSFFNQILERILEGYSSDREDYHCLINRSTCISIDLAHALHPNYAEKHDPQHQPKLGQGVVIKSNAQQRYATHGRSMLPVLAAAERKNLNIQKFVCRNDIPCGTTIGPLQATRSGMPTVDIGCAQLSMHSCRELMSCQDHLDMCNLLQELLEGPAWPEIAPKKPKAMGDVHLLEGENNGR